MSQVKIEDLLGKYVVSPIDGETYCRKNGQFMRHLRGHGFPTYSDYFDHLFPEAIKHCFVCGTKTTFQRTTMTYKQTCGSRDCAGKLTSKVKQSFTKEEWANQASAYKATMAAKSEEEQASRLKKAKATNLERYGHEHPWANLQIRENIKSTMKERYGAENWSTTLIKDQEVADKLNDYDWMYDQHVVQEKTFTRIAQEIGIGDLTVGNRMRMHGIRARSFQIPMWEREFATFLTDNDIPHTPITIILLLTVN